MMNIVFAMKMSNAYKTFTLQIIQLGYEKKTKKRIKLKTQNDDVMLKEQNYYIIGKNQKKKIVQGCTFIFNYSCIWYVLYVGVYKAVIWREVKFKNHYF